jgi:hypothetical protein
LAICAAIQSMSRSSGMIACGAIHVVQAIEALSDAVDSAEREQHGDDQDAIAR